MDLQHGRSCAMLLRAVAVVLVSSCVRGLINKAPQCADGTDTRYLLSSGSFHTCSSAGSLIDNNAAPNEEVYVRNIRCWGWQEFGQSLPPQDGSLGNDVKGVSCGARHSCGLDRNKSVHCWGSNTYGQLDTSRPLQDGPICKYCPQGEYINDQRLQTYQRCVDQADESGYWEGDPICKQECILTGRVGLLAGYVRPDLITVERTLPVYRSDGRFVCSAASVVTGGHHTCVLYGDFSCTNCNTGYVKCFGSNEFGQLDVPECPDGKMAEFRGSEILCTNGTRPYVWANISAGLFHTCGITTNKEVICFGDNRMLQSQAPTSRNFVHVSAGAYHSCAITTDGEVQCWGNSSYGQAANHAELLEQGIITERGRFTQVSCGASHTCGVFIPAGNTIYGQPVGFEANGNDGAKAVCWGADYAGQASPPRRAEAHIVSVSVGWEHSCAVSLDDHSVVCWGGKKSKGLDEPAVLTGPCVSVCAECITAAATPLPQPPALLLSLLALAITAMTCTF